MVALALSFLPGRGMAEEGVAPARLAIVVTRVLGYDEALSSRVGSDFVLGVLFKKGNPASERAAQEALKAWKPIEALTIVGRPFRAIAAPFTGGAAFEALIDKERVDAAFLCEGLDGDIAAITQITRKRKVLSVGSQEAQVKAGVSLAVVPDNGKLQIVLNLPRSREEGAAFSLDLLRVARVLK